MQLVVRMLVTADPHLRAIRVKNDVIVISRSMPQLLFCPNRSDSAVISRIDIVKTSTLHRIMTLTVADLEHHKPLQWKATFMCL